MSKDNASAFAHNYPSQNLDNSPKSLENYPIDFNHLKSHSIECDGGFFIPFKTLQVIPQICSTKTEILVFLCVLRFTAGFKRKSAVLSKSFISKWTGLDTGNVKRGVRGLLTKKIIQKRISKDKRTFEYEVNQIDGVNSTYELSLIHI